MVFNSIDGAVRFAVKVQQDVPVFDGDQLPDRAIRFRIGINIGDAIADGTDLTVTRSIWRSDSRLSARLAASVSPGRSGTMCTVGSISLLRSWGR